MIHIFRDAVFDCVLKYTYLKKRTRLRQRGELGYENLDNPFSYYHLAG